MSKEPRTSTFSVGQRVEVRHSDVKYDKREGVIDEKIGGGVYAVKMPARTRTLSKKAGEARQVEDPAETKNMKLGSIFLLSTGLDQTTPIPAHGLQTFLFHSF